MSNISRDAVLSAAWMLMRRARETGSATDRSNTSEPGANQATEIKLGGQAHTKEAVRKLISAYLDTPTHLSTTFPGW